MSVEPTYPYLFRHPVSAASHLGYCLWASFALALLVRLTSPRSTARWSTGVFGLCLVLLYAASGLYHAVPADRPGLVGFFRRLDLSAIHLLIAGTCTPVFAVLLDTWWRWPLLAMVWLLAVAGALAKWLLPLPPYLVTVGLYAALGALGLVPALWLRRRVGWRGLSLLLGGAAVYAIGGCCEALRWPTPWPGLVGPHEVLHACDMAGSTMHVTFVLRHVALVGRVQAGVCSGCFIPDRSR